MQRGFTIIEILVVISITALLAGLVLTYTSTGRAQVALYVEEAKLAQVMLRAKSLSISTYNRPDVPCGYGVHMDYGENSYEIFSYTASSCDHIEVIIPEDPETYHSLERFTLAPQVTFGEIGLVRDILFIPPDPRTLIWTKEGEQISRGTVALRTQDKTHKVAIEVGAGGQVSF